MGSDQSGMGEAADRFHLHRPAEPSFRVRLVLVEEMVSEWKYDGPISDLKSNGFDLHSGQQASQMHRALRLAIETDGDKALVLALMMKAEM